MKKIFLLLPVLLLCSTEVYAARDGYCGVYANTAVSQFNTAKSLAIPNIIPPVWQSNWDAHYNWCLTVSEQTADQGTRLRQDIIDKHQKPLPGLLAPVMPIEGKIIQTKPQNGPGQTQFPDMVIARQWIEHNNIKCGPSSEWDPNRFNGAYPHWPLTTNASYIFHVEIANKGDGLLMIGQSFRTETFCVRDGKRHSLGFGYTAASDSHGNLPTYATYAIFPSVPGPGKCLIETVIDTENQVKEAIENNNTARFADYPYTIYPPFK